MDGLDNRKANLRIVTRSQNQANAPKYRNNTSGFKGVVKIKSGKFVAKISHEGKRIHLGTFLTAKEASVAYDLAAYSLYGKYAQTNHLVKDTLA